MDEGVAMSGEEPAELDEDATTKYRPVWWMLIVVALAGLAGLLVVRAVLDISWGIVFLIPITNAIVFWWSAAITVSPDGILTARQQVPWDSFSTHQGRWGLSLVGSVQRKGRAMPIKVFLPQYESNWDQGDLGADIRQFAPHLLADAPQPPTT